MTTITTKRKRAIVAMSGGVDSSVAALLMKQRGYEVIGITLQLHNTNIHESKSTRGCCAIDDVYEAKKVARQLDIPHYVMNMEEEFYTKVITPFVNAFTSGLTPSPCVLCNTHIKFEALVLKAKQLQADVLVTGHYADISNYRDTRGRDYPIIRQVPHRKDQTYFLTGIGIEVVRSNFLEFPLSQYKDKGHVRTVAEEAGLVTANKPDSVGTCFVGAGTYQQFLEKELARLGKEIPEPGDIVLLNGTSIGEQHKGLHHYTVGQGKGVPTYNGEKMYVIEMDTKDNTLVIGNWKELHAAKKNIIVFEGMNWHVDESDLHTLINNEIRLGAKFRSTQQENTSVCIREVDSDGRVVLENMGEDYIASGVAPVVAPGQMCALYDGVLLYGGGWVKRTV